MLDGSYFVECSCGSDEHTLRFTVDAEDDTIYTSVFLNQYRPWWKRIWVAVKYVFGYKCKYGHWDVTIMGYQQVEELKACLLKYYELRKKHEQKS